MQVAQWDGDVGLINRPNVEAVDNSVGILLLLGTLNDLVFMWICCHKGFVKRGAIEGA